MATQKKYILIAEDDEFLTVLMKKSLAGKGVMAKAVHNGKDTISAIDTKKPDLLLLDILMPGIDGYGVLRHIQEKGLKIPTVIVTNLSSVEDRQKCKKLGCMDFIVKSDIDDDVLWPAIEKYLK